MKKFMLVLTVLALGAFAMAQNTYSPSTDVLGAHLNYGRGCAGCHAPHSGAKGNGIATTDATTGQSILWGQDVVNLVGQSLNFGGVAGRGSYAETLPGMSGSGPDTNGLLTCLSCHDGNYATGAMMKNKVYETLPATYASQNVPTLLEPAGGTSLLADHPVGLNATVSCGGQYNWDCVETNGKIAMTGPNSTKFVQNYGFFVSPTAYNNTAVVVCTTCHNQHIMNVVNVTAAKSGQAAGYYQTMFFLVGPYNPGSTNAGSNATAQFCRQCHGGEANESNNGSAGTIY